MSERRSSGLKRAKLPQLLLKAPRPTHVNTEPVLRIVDFGFLAL